MADLQTLINSIPDAQDGNVITSDYHNTIKAALQAFAGALGGSTGPRTTTRTLQPNLLPVLGSGAWKVTVGFAIDPGASCNGYISMDLPDGSVIQSMTVIGSKTNTTPTGSVNLLVLPIGGTSPTPLISIDISTAGNPFTLTQTPNNTSLTASALNDMQTVRNSQFKYVIEAQVSTSVTTPTVTINAFQVVYTTAS